MTDISKEYLLGSAFEDSDGFSLLGKLHPLQAGDLALEVVTRLTSEGHTVARMPIIARWLDHNPKVIAEADFVIIDPLTTEQWGHILYMGAHGIHQHTLYKNAFIDLDTRAFKEEPE